MIDQNIETATESTHYSALQSHSAVAATAHPAATEAAIEILRQGGNAVDAAVSAAWVLSVCESSGSGLGGQSTVLISFPDGRTTVLDGHSYAPAAVSRKTVKSRQQKRGYRATTIPSTPATLGAAAAKYGRLPLKQLLAPAIELADAGFPVSKLLRRHIQWCRKALEKCPPTAETFLPDNSPPKRGQLLRQPKLARALTRLAEFGIEDFYSGKIARATADDMAKNQGLMTLEDLTTFEMPVERLPISIDYRGYRILSVPPPGGGMHLLQGLKIAEQFDMTAVDIWDWYETVTRIVQLIYRERAGWPIKPADMPPSLFRWYIGGDRASELAALLRSTDRLPDMIDPEEPGETTHLCVADRDGVVVSLTQSLQSLFGAKVANATFGFFYNNYLITCPRHRHYSRLAGNAIPQSNAAPTMVFEQNGEYPDVPVLALGSAGSRRISSSILQVLSNVLDRHLSLPEAVDAPRTHATIAGKALVERRIATTRFISRLSRHFGRIDIKAPRSYSMGGVQAIARNRDGKWVGAADPRREGTADGY